VPSLIVRSDSEIAFVFIANWAGYGRWKKSGNASLDGKNYISDTKPSIQVETGKKGTDCKIIFSKIEKDGNYLSIKGSWQEGNESYLFDGDFEIQSQ
jgi:hypothetical protein